MIIPINSVLAGLDVLAEDIHKGNLLLARAGMVLSRKEKQKLVAFGVQKVKIKK